jgi:catechol 2,3-dioxygenase-like lactoylglutathione lyase family enzyme
MFRLEGIDHIALAVRDVERSAAWYQEVLGLERRFQDVWGSFPAVVGVGTTALALFPVHGTDPAPPPGRGVISMRHFAFRVDRANFDAAISAMKERGQAVEFQDHGIAHSIYFHDPDGHQIEVTTYELQAKSDAIR